MGRKIFFTLMLMCLVPAWVGGAGAAAGGPRESTLEAYLVKQDKVQGEVLERTDTAAPGDVVEYRLVYRNRGAAPLKGLKVEGPIPANTAYLPKSARTRVPSRFRVSIDGGKTWGPEPVKRMRKQPGGAMKEVVVPPEEYTHVQWLSEAPIAPSGWQIFHYRVRIE